MTKNQKYRPFCQSCNVRFIRYGFTSRKVRRYRCPHCLKTAISYQKRSPSRRPYFHLFRQYVLDGVTYQYLAKTFKVNQRVLLFWFHRYLAQSPPLLPLPPLDRDYVFLLIDGKWNGQRDVTVLYRRSDTKTILLATVMKKEYGSLIAKDLRRLREQGFDCSGVVSDGGTGIVKAVKQVFPEVEHQHCLAHIHRQYTNALGQQPQDPRVQDLRRLVNHLFLIESKAALKDWLLWVKDWHYQNREYLRERRRDDLGRVWFAHPKARKVLYGLLRAAKTSFHFLDMPLMPKTSNALEASIGILKSKRNIHRGLKRCRQPQFTQWFVYFYNQQIMSRKKYTNDKKNNTN